MSRRVRFGLNMPKQRNIRDLSTLRENFNLRAILEYYYNGKLLVWLRDRGYVDYVHKIESFNSFDYANVKEFFCSLFDISDSSVIDADVIVFSQNELEAFLKDDVEQTIYLCGDVFTLSVKYKNKTYIGINKPKIQFVYLPLEKLLDFNISLQNVRLCRYKNLKKLSVGKNVLVMVELHL